MKKVTHIFSAALVCLCLSQTNVMASSHREAPLISNDPLADNTDLYAFRSPCDNSKVVLIANYIPFEHPAGGPNWYTFGENIRYEIHVDNDAGKPGDEVTVVGRRATAGTPIMQFIKIVKPDGTEINGNAD